MLLTREQPQDEDHALEVERPRPGFQKIYLLLDPITREVRYVGRTNNKPARRMAGHQHAARKGGRTPVQQWLRALQAKKLEPEVIVLEEVRDGVKAEKFWARELLKGRHPLLNTIKFKNFKGRPWL